MRWLNPETGRDEAMGCYCQLMLKNWLSVKCWLHEQGVFDAGWPIELDSQ